MIPMMVFSQTRTISGIVSDEKGQGIAYASVIIKSTKKGTSSDVNGQFSLPDMKGDIVLLISAVGFEDKTITVPSSSTSVGIQLISGTPLSEVVVTSFGVKQQKKT